MGNVLRILKRDGLRLLKTPQAIVVCLALLVLPSVYTWYNVLGFWDPYNNTAGVRVCIANEDEGGSSDITGQLDLGDQIVEQLRENHQLDWYFTDEQDAMNQVESGQAYAAIVIPPTFTSDLLTLVTGDFTQPKLQYYVNEKAGPVAPKITDTGVNTLDETINSAFVSTVTGVIATAIDDASTEAQQHMDDSKTGALARIVDASDKLAALRESLSSMMGKTDEAAVAAEQSRGSLEGARSDIDDASSALQTLSSIVYELNDGAGKLVPAIANASTQALGQLSGLSTDLGEASVKLEELLAQAGGQIESGIEEGKGVSETLSRSLGELAFLVDELPEGDVKQLLSEVVAAETGRIQDIDAALDSLASSHESVEARLETLEGATDEMGSAAGTVIDAVQAAASQLNGSDFPALSSNLSQLSALAADLGGAVASASGLVDSTDSLLGQIQTALGSAHTSLAQTDELLEGLQGELDAIRTDVEALRTSSALKDILGEDSLNATVISDFMGAPTRLQTEQLYPLNAYGSAMAPLFMNLTFWIGAFMLVVVMRQEVDSEGIRNLKLYQRYLGRFLFMAVMVVLQAVICCAGLLLIGVQPVSAPALFLAAICASLAYLSIIFSLSLTLQHIGKGICILLVFAQIPGATGLYPVEMTSSFFQAVYPLMPFTYGINALREAICGFYGTQFWEMLGVLGAFFALFLALGLIFRPKLANVNLMVARQVGEGGIFNGEDVEAPLRPYKFSHIIRALSDRQEYNRELTVRYTRFLRWYPRIIRITAAASIAMPVALFLLFALTPAEKVTLLTIWLVWIAVAFVLLLVVESLKDGFERQMRLDHMSDEKLRGLYRNASDDPNPSAEADGAVASDPSVRGEEGIRG
uniref:YhgE/Pip domain-containing protein n=1 Tax=Muribaculaceae bacterium Z82 TaxID=2304548 RepID=A0A7C9N9M8_9BACT